MAQIIELTKGYSTIVDDADYVVLASWKWRVLDNRHGQFYAIRSSPRRIKPRRTVLMHREILDAPTGVMVDHINGDGLDNQRNNLRLCTNAQNQQNRRKHATASSRYKGVCWDKSVDKWLARIGPHGKVQILGWHASELEAARAYDRAAHEMCGEFARFNGV